MRPLEHPLHAGRAPLLRADRRASSASSATGAYATWGYDGGSQGKGRLSSETWDGGAGGAALGAGTAFYSYTSRGQFSAWTVQIGGGSYTLNFGYTDAGAPDHITYSDGERLAYGYDGASGALPSLITTPSGGSAQNLVTGIAYTYSAGYDLDTRLSSLSVTNASSGVTLFGTARTYDGVGNVTGVTQTLPADTDVSAFCYDEQDRVTWAGNHNTPPCTGSAIAAGTLTTASYTMSFSYDTLDRLTSSWQGAYSYGDAGHKHAVTAIGTSYSAAYDAAGDMTCRATSSATTCSGTPRGQLLSYDNEGRLTAWQDKQTSPTSTEAMAYDGEGRRVALKVNGATTYYLGELEEVSPTGVLTKYFPSGGAGLPTALRVGTGGAVSYLATDGRSSVSVSLDSAGNATGSKLYDPYGAVYYSVGSFPTTKAYTGQRADWS